MQSDIKVRFCCKDLCGCFDIKVNTSMSLRDVISSFESKLKGWGYDIDFKREIYEYKLKGTLLDKNSTRTLRELNIRNGTHIVVESKFISNF